VATKTNPQFNFFTVPVLIILVLAVLLGGVYAFLALRPVPPISQITLTPDAKAYVRSLKLSEVEMKAAESYMKNTLVEILGKITNNGDRTLRSVEINCIFYDAYGQVVLRERVPIVRIKDGPVFKPGDSRSFRLPFDSLPATWNQGMPQLVIARIEFGN